MSKRVISTTYNVRLFLKQFSHVEIVKQASEEIEYSTEEERLEKEAKLDRDVIASVQESMRTAEKYFAETSGLAQEVEEKIARKLPEYFTDGPVPNIINNAEELEIKMGHKQKELQDNPPESLVEDLTEEADATDEKESTSNSTAESDNSDLEDNFEEELESDMYDVDDDDGLFEDL